MKCFLNQSELSSRVDSVLESDRRFASAIGISGTPASIVNGVLVPGAVPKARLLELLN